MHISLRQRFMGGHQQQLRPSSELLVSRRGNVSGMYRRKRVRILPAFVLILAIKERFHMQKKPFSFVELLLQLPIILAEKPTNNKKQIIHSSIGLGDSVHNWMERSGIGPKVRSYTQKKGRNCGCEFRRQQLNRLLPYKPQKGKVFLTIGMPHFQDWEGAWATVQSVLGEAVSAGIREQIEIVVVDQSPESAHGEKVRGMLSGWVPRSKYVAQENLGTAAGKNAVFQNASGEWVILLDCHASLKPGSLRKIYDFAAKHRNDENLYSGVMDLGAGYHEHRQSILMLAKKIQKKDSLGLAKATSIEGFGHLRTSDIEYVRSRVAEWKLADGADFSEFILGTDRGFHSHVDRTWRGDSLGRWATDPRADNEDGKPFEVENMAGWFLFCRRDAWLTAAPYHPLMRGFGGEEGVMTLAFAKRGRKSFVAPFARGTHRFGRADGVKFPLQLKDRIRNYALAFHSLGRVDEIEKMREYFVSQRGLKEIENTAVDNQSRSAMHAAEFDMIVASEEWLKDARAKSLKNIKTLDQLYEDAKNNRSDFNEHVPSLREVASQCDSFVEFGTRHGVSSVAILAAQPRRFWTVDKQCQECHIGHLMAARGSTDLQLIQSDSLEFMIPEPIDGMFIDTFHTEHQVFSELSLHSKSIRKFIALHDTEAPWGNRDEGGGSGGGVRAGLAKWQDTEDGRKWNIVRDDKNNHGFLVLQRMEHP